MDLLTRAVRNVGRSLRAAEWGSGSVIPPPGGGLFGGGISSETGALAISTVYLCCKVLYEDQGILPFGAFQGQRSGYRRPIAQQPVIVTEPFGPDLPRAVGFGQMRLSYAMRGNAYVQIVKRDRLGYPTQLYVPHPDKVRVRRNDAGVKQFRIGNTGDWVGGDHVKHIMGPSMPGMDVGLDPITYMRTSLELAGDAATYGRNFFRNGGSPSGVISVKGPGDKNKAREVRDTWEAGHSGLANAHRPAVMFGGATWTPLQITPENAQFLQTRAFGREEICGWFGVPLQRIQAIIDNASQGGGKGLEAIEEGYLTHTWLPWTTAVESLWDTFIAGDESTWTLFDFSALLRTSAYQRAQIAQIHRVTGVRNRNEIRADEGWAPIAGPEGEDYDAPLNSNHGSAPGDDSQPPQDGGGQQ